MEFSRAEYWSGYPFPSPGIFQTQELNPVSHITGRFFSSWDTREAQEYWKEIYDKPRQHIKKQRHQFASKVPYSQSYGFSISHGWMWLLDYKECWVLKNWYLCTVEKTFESSLHSKESKPTNPKGNQPWIFIGRTDGEAEAPVLWPPDIKNSSGKSPDAGKYWRQEEKQMTEDEMVGWHHWLDGPEFEQALGVGDEQGSLACCSPWGLEELDVTEWLNWIECTVIVRASCIK